MSFILDALRKSEHERQRQRAAEARDDVLHLLHAVLQVEAHEHPQRIALPEQVLDHRVRALVRRAEHQHPHGGGCGGRAGAIGAALRRDSRGEVARGGEQ